MHAAYLQPRQHPGCSACQYSCGAQPKALASVLAQPAGHVLVIHTQLVGEYPSQMLRAEQARGDGKCRMSMLHTFSLPPFRLWLASCCTAFFASSAKAKVTKAYPL
jgi:hypothetical protein